MPSATLTFDLETEEAQHRDAVNGMHYHGVLWDLDQWLGSQIKFAEEGVDTATLERVRARLREALDDIFDGFGQ